MERNGDSGRAALFTFALGIGNAMMMPAWVAVTPELVPRAELQTAIGLNSMGINVPAPSPSSFSPVPRGPCWRSHTAETCTRPGRPCC
ncbi:MFS transporter [Thiobacillus sp.]